MIRLNTVWHTFFSDTPSASKMNIGNAYRRALNALCFENLHFAVPVQLDNIKAKYCSKIQSVRPKLYRWNFGNGFWYRIFPVDPGKYKQICHVNWDPDKLQTNCLFQIWFDAKKKKKNVCCTIELDRAGLRPAPHVAFMRQRARYNMHFTQQTHNVEKKSQFNVETLNQRWPDVVLMCVNNNVNSTSRRNVV